MSPRPPPRIAQMLDLCMAGPGMWGKQPLPQHPLPLRFPGFLTKLGKRRRKGTRGVVVDSRRKRPRWSPRNLLRWRKFLRSREGVCRKHRTRCHAVFYIQETWYKLSGSICTGEASWSIFRACFTGWIAFFWVGGSDRVRLTRPDP